MTEPQQRKTVLITGCSHGSIGAALAREFHRRDYHVIATARSLTRLEDLAALGVETHELDVTSTASIQALRASVSSLDILINNAGALYVMPLSDTPMSAFRAQIEVNLYPCLEVTQAFLPLLVRSRGIIVNHGSQNSHCYLLGSGAYSAAKAAVASLTDSLRIELQPLGVRVVYLASGIVESNITMHQVREQTTRLPQGSLYEPIREEFEQALQGHAIRGYETGVDEYARRVVGDLLDGWWGTPKWIWRGFGVSVTYGLWFIGLFWKGWTDGIFRRMGPLYLLGGRVRERESRRSR